MSQLVNRSSHNYIVVSIWQVSI